LIPGGAKMITEKACADRIAAKTATAEIMKCDSCHRELRTSAEWISSGHRIICDICYRNLLNPDKKISFEY
jgi:hypothetical protein